MMNGAGRQYRDREDHFGHSGDGIQSSADGIVQAKARTLIHAAQLPDTLPTRRWGGPGVDAPCSVCGVAIGQHEIDIELELTGTNGDGATNHHFHVRCLSAVEHELRQVKRSRQAPLTMEAPGARGTPEENPPEA
jgi:hypothetical protein